MILNTTCAVITVCLSVLDREYTEDSLVLLLGMWPCENYHILFESVVLSVYNLSKVCSHLEKAIVKR